MKTKLEYIWLDGYKPTQSLRSKTRVETDFGGSLDECPMWAFDGSSTEQAEGNASDCLLQPVAIFPDPDRKNAYLVMTEVLNADGSPHVSNGRATIDDDDEDFWFGYEQEYFLWDPEMAIWQFLTPLSLALFFLPFIFSPSVSAFSKFISRDCPRRAGFFPFAASSILNTNRARALEQQSCRMGTRDHTQIRAALHWR